MGSSQQSVTLRSPRVWFLILLLTIALIYFCSPFSTSKPRPDEEKVVFFNRNRFDQRKHLEFHVNEKYTLASSEKYPRANKDEKEEATKDTDGPPLELELARKHIAQTSVDMLLFLRYHLSSLQDGQPKKSDTPEESSKRRGDLLNYVLDTIVEYQSAMNDQLEVLANNDGWSTWRKEEARDLQETMRSRLHALQNPTNCTEAPVLLCNLKSTSGFGSGLHDVLWCFIKAYYLNLRMVLVTSSWHYAPDGWDTLFQPISDTCGNNEGIVTATGPGKNNDKDRGLLRMLPSDLGHRIIRIHSSPIAWWYGQFFGHLMRPNARLKLFIENLKKKIDFSKPIVGVHVRRTDKVKEEAKGHTLKEYMDHVEDYFIGQELKVPPLQRRIYLATDDPTVIQECQDKFKSYTCLSNSEGALSAANMKTRYTNSSLWGVLADVFMLANTDFLVCTFSSNLCRLVYELRHAIQLKDASEKFISVDVQFYFANVSPPPRLAIYNHVAKTSEEISFNKDYEFQKTHEWAILHEARNGKTANGFAGFRCKQKGKNGLIPTFKTKEIYEAVTIKTIKYNAPTDEISFEQEALT